MIKRFFFPMAQKFILLGIVVAIFATTTKVQATASSPDEPDATATASTTTTTASTTATTATPTTATTTVPTTTTTASTTATTAALTPTTTATPTTATTTVPTPTTTATPTTATTIVPTTTTTASTTATTATPTTATTAAPTTTTTAPTTAKTADPTTAKTADPTTATTADPTTATTAAPTTATTAAPTTAKTAAPTTATTATPTTATTAPTTAKTAAPTTAKTAAPTTATTAAPTTATTTKDPCNPNPCGLGSTCVPRAYPTFVCLCLPGDAYNYLTQSCENAKVFPGKVPLSKVPYDDTMKDPKSKKFKETSDKIIAELDGVFGNDPTYSGSTVLALLPSPSAFMRSGTNVIASVEIKFSANSKINSDKVLEEIKDHKCEECVLNGATFEETSLCTLKPCDLQSTTCKSGNGLYTCPCLEGFIPTDFSTRICFPPCPYGQELKGDGCVNCAFGYSGLNCKENWKLILVIVGSVLGGLLLISLILLPVVATLTSKKSPKKNKNADMGKSNQASFNTSFPLRGLGNNQAGSYPGSANGQAGIPNNGIPIFPRATNSLDHRTQLGNNRQSFDPRNKRYGANDDPENINSYAQPQNSPFTINRPTINPYAQGYSNPHYRHDDRQRLY